MVIGLFILCSISVNKLGNICIPTASSVSCTFRSFFSPPTRALTRSASRYGARVARQALIWSFAGVAVKTDSNPRLHPANVQVYFKVGGLGSLK